MLFQPPFLLLPGPDNLDILDQTALRKVLHMDVVGALKQSRHKLRITAKGGDDDEMISMESRFNLI